MRLSKKEVGVCSVSDWIAKGINLNYDKKQELKEFLMFNNEFCFVKHDDIKSSFLMRLTTPIFLIVLLLLFIFMPFKFIITGNWLYGDSIIFNIIKKWSNKIGIDSF